MKKMVVFKYDEGRDVYNYLNSVYRFNWLQHGREVDNWVVKFLFPKDLEKIKLAKDENMARMVIRRVVEETARQNRREFKEIKDSVERAWYKKEELYFEKLEKFYGKPIFFSQVTAFFTTLPICPYSLREQWFMVSYRFCLEEQIRTICHELMHFMFLHHYGDLALERLGSKEKVEVLKEALTVFLNTDFREVISIPDRGYPQEKKLREFLLRKRREEKSFLNLMEAGINYLQKEI